MNEKEDQTNQEKGFLHEFTINKMTFFQVEIPHLILKSSSRPDFPPVIGLEIVGDSNCFFLFLKSMIFV